MNYTVAVIGGDARQIEMAEYLQESGVDVILIGFDLWNRNQAGIMKATGNGDVPWDCLHAVILPVSGLKPNNKVEAAFSEQPLYLEQRWIQQINKECLIITGISSKELAMITEKMNRNSIALLERDDVAIYNSIPTAEGVLLMVMQETDITVHQSNTLVLGFGRTGQTIASTFLALGAYAKVGTGNPSEKARAEAMGLEVFNLSELKSVIQTADICINSIPTRVLTKDILVHVPNHTVLIDIASRPGGIDLGYAEKRGVKALQAPGLPGVVAPKTAGRVLGRVISQLLDAN
ncbi:dipicolinate synthase subunit A [Salibacterium salarium]|uniref:dipicolinic acid synthetase subunit A n=1 Tax=Salibacterium salarium TaxID=284579 RepID=UPI00278AF155|nr:dipicolinic acid synthetase subunit A [Salibacterium salarium]MDQ0299184.1 dipicolinate synthase subunit A [Salibacterium salarium]